MKISCHVNQKAATAQICPKSTTTFISSHLIDFLGLEKPRLDLDGVEGFLLNGQRIQRAYTVRRLDISIVGVESDGSEACQVFTLEPGLVLPIAQPHLQLGLDFYSQLNAETFVNVGNAQEWVSSDGEVTRIQKNSAPQGLLLWNEANKQFLVPFTAKIASGSSVLLTPNGKRLSECAGCLRAGFGYLVCSGCMNARYCSRHCRRQHWKTHQVDCVESTKTGLSFFATVIVIIFCVIVAAGVYAKLILDVVWIENMSFLVKLFQDTEEL
ncbi:hypothetical protein BDR26DRAFT_850664 [Obelidium mucronatum]|nr:hypothetical protein BDR26DRAFT_850664 [Obelidium mucronatum]